MKPSMQARPLISQMMQKLYDLFGCPLMLLWLWWIMAPNLCTYFVPVCGGCFCDAVNLILAFMVIYIMVNDYPFTLLLSMGPVIIQHMLLLYQPVVLLTIDFYISPLVLYIHE